MTDIKKAKVTATSGRRNTSSSKKGLNKEVGKMWDVKATVVPIVI